MLGQDEGADAMSWQTMDSAPKDGVLCIAWNGKRRFALCERGRWRDEKTNQWMRPQPWLWQPAPELPK